MRSVVMKLSEGKSYLIYKGLIAFQGMLKWLNSVGKKFNSQDYIKANPLKSDVLFILFLVVWFASMVAFGYFVFLVFMTVMNWSKIAGLLLFFVFVYLVAKYCSY